MKALLLGDICAKQPEVAKLFAAKKTDELFGDTRRLFEGKDLVAVNLECALTESEVGILKHGPCLKSPYETADVLAELGVNLAGLSNNHVFDFGAQGIADTKRTLESRGIAYTGFGDNYEDSRRNFVLEKDGEKIAVIAVCEHEYSYAKPDKMGARPFDEFDTIEDIRKANAECDRVIVMYHGGKEQCRYPSPRLMRVCRAMVRAGADVVLCQHTHCISSYENYCGGHILYGQGNSHFLWRLNDEYWGSSLAVEYDTVSGEISFTPLLNLERNIAIATGEEGEKIMRGFEERSRGLLDGSWIEGWRAFCRDSAENYIKVVNEAGRPDSTEAQNLQFAHYLDCEAHLDVFRELFQTRHMRDENY